MSASREACSGQGETERDPCAAAAGLPQELPALPMTLVLTHGDLEPRQNIGAASWAMGSPHSCHHYCWNSSAKVFLPLLKSPCALTGKLSRNPCVTTVLFFGSHFPSTLTEGTFTEALCFPASPLGWRA